MDDPSHDRPAATTLADFEDGAYDFTVPTTPRQFYIIAATPRCGGTYLSQCLWRTGVMGAPHEYFGFYGTMLRAITRFNPRNLDEFVTKLMAARTSANGVFGVKVHFDHLQFMLLSGVLNRMQKMAVISIERQDRLAQAVSHARALQTVQWTSLMETSERQPKYDATLIRWCLNHIDTQKKGWQDFFAQNELSPYRVDYDEFAANPDTTVTHLLDSTGFPREPVSAVSLPEMQRQADTLNAEWIARYKLEAPEP